MPNNNYFKKQHLGRTNSSCDLLQGGVVQIYNTSRRLMINNVIFFVFSKII